MIMVIEPYYANQPSGSWTVFCRLCNRALRNKDSRWKARQSAAQHLWAHRSDAPPKPNGRSAKTAQKNSRKQLIAELTEGRPPCPTPTKRQHISAAEAKDHIAKLDAAGRGNPDYNAYRCQCGVWHIGHSAVSFERRIRKVTRRRK